MAAAEPSGAPAAVAVATVASPNQNAPIVNGRVVAAAAAPAVATAAVATAAVATAAVSSPAAPSATTLAARAAAAADDGEEKGPEWERLTEELKAARARGDRAQIRALTLARNQLQMSLEGGVAVDGGQAARSSQSTLGLCAGESCASLS